MDNGHGCEIPKDGQTITTFICQTAKRNNTKKTGDDRASNFPSGV